MHVPGFKVVKEVFQIMVDLIEGNSYAQVAHTLLTGPPPYLAEHFPVEFVDPIERKGRLPFRRRGGQIFGYSLTYVFCLSYEELLASLDAARNQPARILNRRRPGRLDEYRLRSQLSPQLSPRAPNQ